MFVAIDLGFRPVEARRWRTSLVHAVEVCAGDVDLPQPEGPMKAVTSFSGTLMEIFFSACDLP